MEKVKNVVIGVLAIGILLMIVYLTMVLTVVQTVKGVLNNMYDTNNPDEMLVYTVERENAKGDKIKVPIINLDYENIYQINKENYEENISDVCEQRYTYYVENNLLYVLIATKYNEETKLSIYRIDTLSGELVVDNNLLFEKYYNVSLNKDKYLEVMKKECYDKWLEKNPNSDINQFEQFIYSMPIIHAQGRGFVLVNYDTNSDKYDAESMVEINLYDVINKEEVK